MNIFDAHSSETRLRMMLVSGYHQTDHPPCPPFRNFKSINQRKCPEVDLLQELTKFGIKSYFHGNYCTDDKPNKFREIYKSPYFCSPFAVIFINIKAEMAGIATVAVCKETLSHVGSDKLYAMRVRFFICEQSACLWKGYHCWEVPPGHRFP